MMMTEIRQLWRQETLLCAERRFQNRLQRTAGCSTGIVPSGPLFPELKAAENDASRLAARMRGTSKPAGVELASFSLGQHHMSDNVQKYVLHRSLSDVY